MLLFQIFGIRQLFVNLLWSCLSSGIVLVALGVGLSDYRSCYGIHVPVVLGHVYWYWYYVLLHATLSTIHYATAV